MEPGRDPAPPPARSFAGSGDENRAQSTRPPAFTGELEPAGTGAERETSGLVPGQMAGELLALGRVPERHGVRLEREGVNCVRS